MGVAHLDAYARLPQVRVVALCSKNSRSLAGDFSAAGGNLNRPHMPQDTSSMHKYSNLERMLEDRDLDAIDICLPTDMHADASVAALAAGKHVLCEKPMALSVPDCERMIEASRRHNRVLMIAQVLRFWEEYRYLQQFAHSGEYGLLRSATFTRSCGLPDWSGWLLDDARSGGPILDLLIHDIDQILLLFGTPDRVVAKSMGGPKGIAASFLYPSNAEVRLQGGWFPAGTPFSMGFQVRAERAMLELTTVGLFISGETGQRKKVDLAGEDPFETELAYFAGCCRRGSQPDACPPRDSAKAVEIALLLKQSSASGGEQLKC